MVRFYHFLIRVSSFLGKEIAEVIRQPRLILTLILGPFLILLLFGVGYKNEPRTVKALFVVDPNSEMAHQIQQQASTISSQLIYAGITANEAEAKQRLSAGQVDLVIVAPANAYEMIQKNQQAVFQIYHNEIDPAQIGYIQYLGQIYVQEVNRRILSISAQLSQTQATDIKKDVQAARKNASAMKSALAARNTVEARGKQTEMKNNLNALSLAVGASAGLLTGVQQGTGNSNKPNAAQDLLGLLNNVRNSPASNSEIQDGQSDYSTQISVLGTTEKDLADLENKLSQFQQISPDILVSPFSSTTSSVAPIQLTPMDFFTPGVIILLLQHIAVTIAALSIVRERRSGTMELFRVSSISSGEIMIGKYLSYLIFGGFLAAILAILLAYGLKIPMLGRWGDFSIVVIAVIFASLGYGFIISLIAQTESQAVQLAMIMLLLSVFFSGFLLDLRYLIPSVKIVSWSLPATYGSILLQNIMLRGNQMAPIYIGGLLGIGILLFVLSWLLMKRKMAHE